MLRSTIVLALLILAIVGLIQSQPISQDSNVYGYHEFEPEQPVYLMKLLKRQAVFFPPTTGNHDKMIKAILKSRRY